MSDTSESNANSQKINDVKKNERIKLNQRKVNEIHYASDNMILKKKEIADNGIKSAKVILKKHISFSPKVVQRSSSTIQENCDFQRQNLSPKKSIHYNKIQLKNSTDDLDEFDLEFKQLCPNVPKIFHKPNKSNLKLVIPSQNVDESLIASPFQKKKISPKFNVFVKDIPNTRPPFFKENHADISNRRSGVIIPSRTDLNLQLPTTEHTIGPLYELELKSKKSNSQQKKNKLSWSQSNSKIPQHQSDCHYKTFNNKVTSHTNQPGIPTREELLNLKQTIGAFMRANDIESLKKLYEIRFRNLNPQEAQDADTDEKKIDKADSEYHISDSYNRNSNQKKKNKIDLKLDLNRMSVIDLWNKQMYKRMMDLTELNAFSSRQKFQHLDNLNQKINKHDKQLAEIKNSIDAEFKTDDKDALQYKKQNLQDLNNYVKIKSGLECPELKIHNEYGEKINTSIRSESHKNDLKFTNKSAMFRSNYKLDIPKKKIDKTFDPDVVQNLVKGAADPYNDEKERNKKFQEKYLKYCEKAPTLAGPFMNYISQTTGVRPCSKKHCITQDQTTSNILSANNNSYIGSGKLNKSIISTSGIRLSPQTSGIKLSPIRKKDKFSCDIKLSHIKKDKLLGKKWSDAYGDLNQPGIIKPSRVSFDFLPAKEIPNHNDNTSKLDKTLHKDYMLPSQVQEMGYLQQYNFLYFC